jgi:hypothetical protein
VAAPGARLVGRDQLGPNGGDPVMWWLGLAAFAAVLVYGFTPSRADRNWRAAVRQWKGNHDD